MTYKNKKTGQVVKTTGKVSGADWELVQEKSAVATPKPVAESKGKKK